jgi:hypothetical protein
MNQTAADRKRKFRITAFLFATACCNLALLFQSVPKLRNGYQDFAIYYAAASVVGSRRCFTTWPSSTRRN